MPVRVQLKCSSVCSCPAAGPGAVQSRLRAVGRAHSAALCWEGKALLESWCWAQWICCSHHKSSSFREEGVQCWGLFASRTPLSYVHGSDLQTAVYGSLEFSSPLAMLCCIKDVRRVNFLKHPRDFMVTSPPTSSGQWVLTKLCLGSLWDTYPLENSTFVLSFSGPTWVEREHGGPRGISCFLTAVGFSAGLVWVVETKIWVCCPSHPSSLDSSCLLTRNSGFESQVLPTQCDFLGTYWTGHYQSRRYFFVTNAESISGAFTSTREKNCKSLEINFALVLGEMTWGLRKSSFNLC